MYYAYESYRSIAKYTGSHRIYYIRATLFDDDDDGIEYIFPLLSTVFEKTV